MGMGLFIDEKVSKIVNRLKGRIVTCFKTNFKAEVKLFLRPLWKTRAYQKIS